MANGLYDVYAKAWYEPHSPLRKLLICFPELSETLNIKHRASYGLRWNVCTWRLALSHLIATTKVEAEVEYHNIAQELIEEYTENLEIAFIYSRVRIALLNKTREVFSRSLPVAWSIQDLLTLQS